MNTWWYAKNGKKTGPVEEKTLIHLYQSQKIDLGTMLWREGMECWQPLGKIQELEALRKAVPPPFPKEPPADLSFFPQASLWRRFFARSFDLLWETSFIAFFGSAAISLFSERFATYANDPTNKFAITIIILPIALIFDACICKVFGNSPGKALLGLKAGTTGGAPLTLRETLNRNMILWSSGYALGFPILHLFTMLYQAKRLRRGQQASYDEYYGYTIYAKPISLGRKLVFGSTLAVGFVGLTVLAGKGLPTQVDGSAGIALKEFSWVNPNTKHSTKIDPRWKYSTQADNNGQQRHLFNDLHSDAAILLTMQVVPGLDIRGHVQEFKRMDANGVQFLDPGKYYDDETDHGQWVASGPSGIDSNRQITVIITQRGTTFWKIIAIESAIEADRNDHVLKVVNSLLGTIS
jgi:hypothetical protein